MLRSKDIALLALVLLVSLCGFISLENRVGAVERPAALVSYPGATNVRLDKVGKIIRITYQVNSGFPAVPVIQWISEKLRKGGWHTLRYDFLNPGALSSQVQGWQVQMAGTSQPGVCVHQWLGSWNGPSGDVVTYSFRYKGRGCSTSGLDDLDVTGWYASAAVAEETQKILKEGRDGSAR